MSRDDTEERCELNDMPRSWCAHCRGGDQSEPAPERSDWFPARYAGFCAACGRPFDRGDDIARTDDGYICRERHDHT